ncbi:putative ripening-related protein 6 [Aegilops tauschii subsp. strangulata]|uniref:putative ripening-related protein 6 n=1 Tax=Aegilops tauschii subsp. strangulata TaxID=200361 RepID=UPI003CC8DF75
MPTYAHLKKTLIRKLLRQRQGASAMASAKLVVVAALVILLQASTSAVARHHHHHKHKKPHCPSTPGGHGGTPGIMTVNGFEKGQEGGGPAACDGKYHSNKDMIAALSTRWYAGGRRCHKTIRITSKRDGRTVEARVVDECDSNYGCKDDVVDTSAAVWEALGLDTDVGVVPVTWSDA